MKVGLQDSRCLQNMQVYEVLT